jgi:tetratricopeptide (TPR) repeat protein
MRINGGKSMHPHTSLGPLKDGACTAFRPGPKRPGSARCLDAPTQELRLGRKRRVLIPILIILLSACASCDNGSPSKKAKVYFERGLIHVQAGRYDEAIADFSKAIDLDPNHAQARTQRGLCYGNKGDYDRGISDFDEAIGLNPRFADAYLGRASFRVMKGQHDQGISDYTKAIDLRPRDAIGYAGRAGAYFMKRELDKSWEDVKKAQELGYKVSPKFLNALRKASGREN